jgi:hypothetical protein
MSGAISIFARLATKLIQNGYSPIPLWPGENHPRFKGWDRLRRETLTAAEVETLARQCPQLGLAVAGGHRGLVPVDVDTDDPDILMALSSVLPSRVVSKRGRRGFTAFFRDAGGLVKAGKFCDPQGAPLVEILVSGATAIPPTIHPELGRPYRWLGLSKRGTLFDDPVDALAEITPDHIAAISTVLEPWLARPARRRPRAQAGAGREEILTGSQDARRQAAYGRAVLKQECRNLAEMSGSGRNAKLFRTVCKLGACTHHGIIPQDEIRAALLEACATNGLIADDGERQCRATIESGFRTSRGDPLPFLRDRPNSKKSRE